MHFFVSCSLLIISQKFPSVEGKLFLTMLCMGMWSLSMSASLILLEQSRYVKKHVVQIDPVQLFYTRHKLIKVLWLNEVVGEMFD